ncbi:hypothetical protein OUY22_07605 [Nonomuraea sp. MCN248]|uniref:DUF6745 domain-containing protein n=1 Tax=Nonomuraea corallina TaxID=2989783 RepID=A0ABT4S7T6_9ACTN|nr:hypothetical protein [Nonomuraea corallina]MDA0633283.1 hypothetical protein [Nonomuraea corallina]
MSARTRREAATIREEWLGLALSTRPCDRQAAEAAISELYLLAGFDRPRFHWASSPLTALATLPPGVRPRPGEDPDRVPHWPVVTSLSRLAAELGGRIDAAVRGAHRELHELVRREVHDPLAWSARRLVPVLEAAHGRPLRRVSWYEDVTTVAWQARHDALRRLGGVEVFSRAQERQARLWAAVARSCGWWWPRRDLCVLSERPAELRTEVCGERGEVRPHHGGGPAVRFADGWDVYAWHGTRVPCWVITDPSVERISRERNVEVRRCAIERLGWGAYLDRAGLRLVAAAPDPGNPGSELRLYDVHTGTRVLLAVNGSVERDGTRRRHGLTVPWYFDDPIAAAGWTYGLSADQYAGLLRRT